MYNMVGILPLLYTPMLCLDIFPSNTLNLNLATNVFEFQELRKEKLSLERDCKHAMEQDSQNTCATLYYIYHIFYKFAFSIELCRGSIRDINLHFLPHP